MIPSEFCVLEWAHDALPPIDEIDAIAGRVWADLDADIDRPKQCVFRIVSLTDDDNGPSVFVTGSATTVFHCRYRAVTDWSR